MSGSKQLSDDVDPKSLVSTDHMFEDEVIEENHIEKLVSATCSHHEAEEDVVYDSGYAWVVCLCCFFMNFCTWGMNLGFAIYFANYLDLGTFAGATKLDYAWIGGIAFGVGLAFLPVVNWLVPILGMNGCLLLGNCLQFTALMLASWLTKLWQLYLTQGLMNSFGLAFILIPQLIIIPMWFKKKRVFAGGITSAGLGAGGILFNLGMQAIVEAKLVHWALRAQAIILFGIMWFPTVFIRSRHKSSGAGFKLVDKQILMLASFYILAMYIIFCIFSYVILLYSLAQWTTTLGESVYRGLIVSACVQVGLCVFRPIFGVLGTPKFLGPLTMGSILYTLCGIFCLAMWIPLRNFAAAVAFAIIEGGMMGFIYSMFTPVCAAVFGMKKMSTAFSNLWVLQGLAAIFGPVIGIKLRRGEGAYVDPTQYQDCAIFCGVCFIAAGFFLFLERGYLVARNRIMVAEGHEVDPDKIDFAAYTVPPMAVLRGCFGAGKF